MILSMFYSGTISASNDGGLRLDFSLRKGEDSFFN